MINENIKDIKYYIGSGIVNKRTTWVNSEQRENLIRCFLRDKYWDAFIPLQTYPLRTDKKRNIRSTRCDKTCEALHEIGRNVKNHHFLDSFKAILKFSDYFTFRKHV